MTVRRTSPDGHDGDDEDEHADGSNRPMMTEQRRFGAIGRRNKHLMLMDFQQSLDVTSTY